jgi:hypothetical protein
MLSDLFLVEEKRRAQANNVNKFPGIPGMFLIGKSITVIRLGRVLDEAGQKIGMLESNFFAGRNKIRFTRSQT